MVARRTGGQAYWSMNHLQVLNLRRHVLDGIVIVVQITYYHTEVVVGFGGV